MEAVNRQSRTSSSTRFAPTTTTTFTYPCASSVITRTSASVPASTGNGSNHGVNFGPLLGNFSAMTVALYGNDSNGRSYATYSYVVLNRTSSPSGTIYEVNVTSRSVGRSVTVSEDENSTTTLVSPGNITRFGSVLEDISSNGSVISTKTSIGNQSFAITPLQFFTPVIFGVPSSSSQVRTISNSTVRIGSTVMGVTNLERPVTVEVMVQEACSGRPTSMTVVTVSHWDIQVGRVPGTTFNLVTRYSQEISIRSNSSSPISPSEFSTAEQVTSFTVA